VAPFTRGQLLVYAVTWLEREVLNGGFAQCFWNPSRSLYAYCPEGLEASGLHSYAEVVRQACAALFAQGTPSPVRAERIRALRELAARHRSEADADDEELQIPEEAVTERFDAAFPDLHGDGQEFYDAIADYVRGHPDEFLR